MRRAYVRHPHEGSNVPSLQGIDTGSGFGVHGSSPTGAGVVGEGPKHAGVVASSVTGSGVSAFSDSGAGVLTLSNSGPGVAARSVDGVGVSGSSDHEAGVVAASVSGPGLSSFSDSAAGVLSLSNSGPGVSGQSVDDAGVSGSSDNAAGVAGSSGSGVGVSGESKTDNGVLGSTEDGSHAGVFGRSAATDRGNGVVGLAEGTRGVGVFGQAERRGVGVVGNGATGVVAEGGAGPGLRASSEQSHGVVGSATAERASGVAGRSRLDAGVTGTAEAERQPGVLGVNEAGGSGVLGKTTGSDKSFPIASVAGLSGLSEGTAAGVVGSSAHGLGVVGLGHGMNGVASWLGPGAGVFGGSPDGPGVAGYGKPGVLGWTAGGDAPAISAFGPIAGLGGANLLGNVSIAGTLKVAVSKQFVIDHPLDAENRYLRHAAVEAPALKTFYDGAVTLDDRGRARVTLPDWFSALNSDLCYSLTPLRGPAPDLHVAEEFDGEGFTIGGGRPGARASWQVTGVRQDRSATAAPLIVEEDKEPENVGRYVDPAAFGREPTDNLAWAADLIATRDELAERQRTAPSPPDQE